MSELPIHRPDIVEEATQAVIWKLRRGPLLAWVRIYAGMLQEAEDLIWSVLEQRLLSQATGTWLDLWGDALNEPRGGLADGDYRRFLQARILTNLSDGTTDTIVTIFRLITDAPERLLVDDWPAGLWYQYQVDLPNDTAFRERFLAQADEAISAGVELLYAVEYPSGAARWVDEEHEDAPPFPGWSGTWGEAI